MEDFQTYIESGRLEQYVLGELDAATQAEVERMATRYPQVRQELDELQDGLGVFAQAYAVAPPPAMRDRVLSGVFAQLAAAPTAQAAPVAAAPIAVAAPVVSTPIATPVAEVSPMRVSASNPDRAVAAPVVAAAPTYWSKGWAIAASIALLLSLVGNALLYSRWQNTSSELVALQDTQARFANTNQVLERKLGNTREQLHVLRSPAEFKLVALAGTPAHPQAQARVLFNRADHRVFLDVQDLPKLPADKQYQLWALNNGKPIDAGVLTVATADGDNLQQMKDIASAQTFAMTVEPVGGSAGPTLSTMTVVGNI